MFEFNLHYFAIIILLFLLQIAIAFYVHDNFIAAYFGAFLVVILFCCFLKSFVKISVWVAAALVLLFSFTIETAQYFKLDEKLELQHSKIAKVILRNSFAWTDLLAHTLSILDAVIIKKILFKTKE